MCVKKWCLLASGVLTCLALAPNVAAEERQPAIRQVDKESGTYQVQLPADADVTSARVAVWSLENGQDDLVWQDLVPAGDGSWQAQVDLADHGSLVGDYISHLYVQTRDGKTIGYDLGKQTFSASQPVIQQTDSGFSIGQRVHEKGVTYHTAVWSDASSQDDLIWYTYDDSSDIPFDQHRDYGTYHLHTYIYKDNVLVGSYAQTQEVQVPQLQISVSKASDTRYELTISGVPSYISQVQVPTWSLVNDQDDLVWHQAEQVDASTYQLSLPIKQHGFGAGDYVSHIYLSSALSNGVYAGGQAFKIDPVVTYGDPDYSSQGTDNQESYTARVSESADSRAIQKVSFAVWSAEDQSDLVWFKEEAVNGQAQTTVSLPMGINDARTYHTHAYVTYSDGQEQGYVLSDQTLERQAQSATAGQPRITAYMGQTNTYPVGQCTWGVKNMAPWIPNYLGNANQWLTNAASLGFRTGDQARVGAIAVWLNDGGGYGHVAYVTEVASNHQIKVKESNYAGNMTVNDYRSWFDPTSSSWGGQVAYIYPD